jgi:hypothetical protein
VDGYYVLADGRIVSGDITPDPAAIPVVKAHGSVWTAIHDYWWEGFGLPILVVDAVAVFLCVVDTFRFQQHGRSLGDALQFARDAFGNGQLLDWPAIVFGFFLIVLPVLLRFLVPHPGPDRPQPVSPGRKLWGLITRTAPSASKCETAESTPSPEGMNPLTYPGWLPFSIHFVLAAGFAGFTLLGMSMETLSGWGKDEAITYNFPSFWVAAILWIKPFYSGLLLPVLRKFVVRRAGHEPTHLSDVLKEVATEDHLKGEG